MANQAGKLRSAQGAYNSKASGPNIGQSDMGASLEGAGKGAGPGEVGNMAGEVQEGFCLKPGHNGGSSGPAPFSKQDADESDAENGLDADEDDGE